jgi:hypothetical protein
MKNAFSNRQSRRRSLPNIRSHQRRDVSCHMEDVEDANFIVSRPVEEEVVLKRRTRNPECRTHSDSLKHWLFERIRTTDERLAGEFTKCCHNSICHAVSCIEIICGDKIENLCHIEDFDLRMNADCGHQADLFFKRSLPAALIRSAKPSSSGTKGPSIRSSRTFSIWVFCGSPKSSSDTAATSNCWPSWRCSSGERSRACSYNSVIVDITSD